MADIRRRLQRLEDMITPPAGGDAARAAALLEWVTDNELMVISDHLEVMPGDDWTPADQRILDLLTLAHQRRAQYGSVQAWRAPRG